MKTLTLYLNGTLIPKPNVAKGSAFPKDEAFTSLANLLYSLTIQDEDQTALCIDGCGIDDPYWIDFRGIFAWHLPYQVEELNRVVRAALQKTENLRLNLYGFSRGGIGAYLLCKKLKDIPVERLSIHVIAFDPVPGNPIQGAAFDKYVPLMNTLARQVEDLSDCPHIQRAYSIFTNKTNAMICYAPILPQFSPETEVQTDVIPGRHGEAQYFYYAGPHNPIKPGSSYATLNFHQSLDFLREAGTRFTDNPPFALDPDLSLSTCECTRRRLSTLCQSLSDVFETPHTRKAHFKDEIKTSPRPGALLNQYHLKLDNAAPNTPVVLYFEKKPLLFRAAQASQALILRPPSPKASLKRGGCVVS